jgi:nicotinate-nucleotide pyrophosphorylase (carboxylating)
VNLDESVFDTDAVSRLIEIAIEEDLGEEGDVTARVVPEANRCEARIVYREGGVVAGLPLATRVLARIAPDAVLEPSAADGDVLEVGAVAGVIKGPSRGVLAAERLILNFMQRLSGTATATRRFVDAVAGTAAKLLDTRKTTPGWRTIEKYAVLAGGGHNHRMGLYDQVLIKDNHLVSWGGEGSIPEVIAEARRVAPPNTPIEVEVTTLEGGLSAARSGADIILLDNFGVDALRDAVSKIRADAQSRGAQAPALEASGGISLETVGAVAQTGVDRISTGWITHSARALDIALDFVELPQA